MKGNILVAYASKYGATGEIAEKIGQVLRQEGLQADVLPVDGIRDLTGHEAVILGSAVYIGKWQKEAAEFLQTHEKSLAARPVWLFSSGPTGAGDPVHLLEGWRLPPAAQPIADRIRPRHIAVFHGYINPDRLNLIERLVLKGMKKEFGDFRDWDTIITWATRIASTLKAGEPNYESSVNRHFRGVWTI